MAVADQQVSKAEVRVLLEGQNRAETCAGFPISSGMTFQQYADTLAQDCARLGCDLGQEPVPESIVTSVVLGVTGSLCPIVFKELRGLVHADGLHLVEQIMMERFEEAWGMGRRP
jgi:hypothetical protein